MILLVILLVFLIIECSYFHAQAEALCEFKEDYRNYTVSLKKILHDYNRTKERLDLLENFLENEKKNENQQERLQENTDAELNDLLFSLPCASDSQDDYFVLVNRDIPYLQQTAFIFILEECGKTVADCVLDEELLEYNDLLNKSMQPKHKQATKKQGLRRTRSVKEKKRINGLSLCSDILFSWPVERSKCWLSSLFGPRFRADGSPGFHYGVDMAALRGTPVKAAASGIVMEARYARGYGKTILIVHDRQYKTRYAHLNKIAVMIGQKVNRGSFIGLVGSTGNVRTTNKDGSHLHFEVYAFNRRVNPLYFFAN